ncbi:hypothetical protein [Acinetobacter haemolyticus]|nr:hypothetical protein [Acinetobacter haemolyticus]
MSIQLTDVQLRKIKEFIEVLGNEKPNYAGMYRGGSGNLNNTYK